MTITTIKCDECGKTKGEENHWLKVGVQTMRGGKITLIAIGAVKQQVSPDSEFLERPMSWTWEVHDLCGLACLYKHLDKLVERM